MQVPLGERVNESTGLGGGHGLERRDDEKRRPAFVEQRATARARSTNPSYIDWNRWKKRPMSSRNCEPRIRSATTENGREARPTKRDR